ncbi:hypothetical protein NXX53_06745 [Bacteroides salyersiae]|nr:hypothetical protein [Bacteroides salyersiae]
MAFIETLEKVREYLEKKTNWTNEESSLLAQVRQDLNGFPISVLSREDLAVHGFDAQLIDDADMATVARKMGEDYWEQTLAVYKYPLSEIPRKYPQPNVRYAALKPPSKRVNGFATTTNAALNGAFMKFTLVEDIEPGRTVPYKRHRLSIYR